MRILLTHRYFWPDTPPYGAMLRTIAADLAKAGHDVSVFTSRPSYGQGIAAPRREDVDGFQIRRCFVFAEKRGGLVRLLNVILYCWALFWRIVWARPDVVTAATFPPVLAGATAAFAARLTGARLIYHMQDIHPEVSRYSGDRMGDGRLFRILQAIDRRTLRRAKAAVVLSHDMGATLSARGDALPKIAVINNIAVEAFDATPDIPEALSRAPGTVRIIFAGNLGRFQNLELLSEGIGQLFPKYPALELLFLGNGVAEAALKARWADTPQVRFWPMLPFAQAEPVIRQADIGLVSLAPDIYRVSYPSKVLTYLGLGLPMLALVEPDSALAGDIRESGIGVVPAASTPQAIADALEPLIKDRHALQIAADRVQEYHDRESATPVVLAKWRDLVTEVGEAKA